MACSENYDRFFLFKVGFSFEVSLVVICVRIFYGRGKYISLSVEAGLPSFKSTYIAYAKVASLNLINSHNILLDKKKKEFKINLSLSICFRI